ncbi:MAG: GIY-YIG nuclease family protein [Nitrospirota bacterium]
MFYTYILRSLKTSVAIYIGYTSDLKARLDRHNSPNNNGYTKRHAPWEIETYIAFTQKVDAQRFELYLKSSSGKAFMRKRLLSDQFIEAIEKFKNGRTRYLDSERP